MSACRGPGGGTAARRVGRADETAGHRDGLLDREASPSAAIIDSQSARSTQKGGPRSTRSATTRARRSRGQATCPRRHLGLLLAWRASGRRAGSRRRGGLISKRVRRRFPFIEVSSPTPDTGRAGAAGPPASPGAGGSDRQARSDARASSCRQALDRRAHARLDQPKSPPRPRLRKPRTDRRCPRPPGDDQNHAKTLGKAMNFLDGLL